MIAARAVIAGLCICIAALIYVLLERDLAWSKVPVTCADPTERERVRDLSLKGIDEGFTQAVAHLFSIWTKDPETEQPRRAQVGMANAISAHARARKLALAWDPPHCAPGG